MNKNFGNILRRNIIVFLFLVSSSLGPVYGAKGLLRQETGIYQDQPGKHFPLGKVSKIELDFDNVPLKNLKKAGIHKGLIYLLDWDREKIYVIDKQGKYIRSIGGTGEGPGDLQNPSDFFISKDEMIYVICGTTKRIETYDLNGKESESIRMKKIPFEFSIPTAVLFDGNTFFIGGEFNHLISTLDCRGKYIDTILKRRKPLKFPGSHVVFEPQLDFTSDYNNIIILDSLHGIFGILDKTGKVQTSFSFNSKRQNREANGFKKRTAGLKTTAYMRSLSLQLWSSFCMDNHGNIYTIPLADRGKEGIPWLVAFSPAGRFLYKKLLKHNDLAGKDIRELCSDGECLLVITTNYDLIKFNWRKNK